MLSVREAQKILDRDNSLVNEYVKSFWCHRYLKVKMPNASIRNCIFENVGLSIESNSANVFISHYKGRIIEDFITLYKKYYKIII